jgi:AraC-like DNA-binding protein
VSERPPDAAFTFVGGDVWLSEFVLPPTHPTWQNSNRTTLDVALIAFPRTSVGIRHEHRPEVVADPLSAIVYSPGTAYRRRLVSHVGDACTILAVSYGVLAQVVAPFAGDVDPATHRFPFTAASVGRREHMSLQRIRESLASGLDDARDQIREELYLLVQHVVASGYSEQGEPRSRPQARAHQELAHAVREEVGREVSDSTGLDELARKLGLSPFHLVRTFRAVTGRPIHAYRTELRLRSSLPLIASGMRLADVALEVGFASHAHLTDRFVRAYGVTPARWREMSKNMEAPTGRASIA